MHGQPVAEHRLESAVVRSPGAHTNPLRAVSQIGPVPGLHGDLERRTREPKRCASRQNGLLPSRWLGVSLLDEELTVSKVDEIGGGVENQALRLGAP